MRMLCVCVAYLSVRVCLCVCECLSSGIRVVFAYNYYTHLILFFAFLYPRKLPPDHVTKHFVASVTQRGGLQHQDGNA